MTESILIHEIAATPHAANPRLVESQWWSLVTTGKGDRHVLYQWSNFDPDKPSEKKIGELRISVVYVKAQGGVIAEKLQEALEAA